LFAGSNKGGDNWAVITTLIENCKLTGINQHTWLTATLSSLADGHPASRIDDAPATRSRGIKIPLTRFIFNSVRLGVSPPMR
jgi:hypothetical protein